MKRKVEGKLHATSGSPLRELDSPLRELGTGPRGTVYEVAVGGRRLAAKVFHPELSVDRPVLERFLRDSPERLCHPNLPVLEGLEENPGGQFVCTMSVLHGDCLEQFVGDLKRGTSDTPSLHPLAVGPDGETHPQFQREAVKLLLEVAEGLGMAHASQIEHGRITPRNLIFSLSGRLVLTDFGGHTGPSENPATSRELLFRAPETLRGATLSAPARACADVYSLGVILFELLWRRSPFEAETTRKLVKEIRKGYAPGTHPPPAGVHIPPALERCVFKAIAKKPQDRYPDAAALADDLRRYLADEQPLALRETGEGENERPRRTWTRYGGRLQTRTRLAASLIFGALLLLAFFGGRLAVDDERSARQWVSQNVGSPQERSLAHPYGVTSLRPPADAFETTLDSLAPLEAGAVILESVGISAKLPPRELDDRQFLALQRRLLAAVVTAEDAGAAAGLENDPAQHLLCNWSLSLARELDGASRDAGFVPVSPNITVALVSPAPRGFTEQWIAMAAALDGPALLAALDELPQRRPTLVALLSALASLEDSAAGAAIERITRQHNVAVGFEGLRLLAERGEAEALLAFAQGEYPLAFRVEALRRLGTSFHGESFPELQTLALSSPEPTIRSHAFEILTATHDGYALDVLVGSLDDLTLREASLKRWRQLDSRQGAELAVQLLEHSSGAVRQTAVEILGRTCYPDLLPGVAAFLFHTREEVRQAARQALVTTDCRFAASRGYAAASRSALSRWKQRWELFVEDRVKPVTTQLKQTARTVFARFADAR